MQKYADKAISIVQILLASSYLTFLVDTYTLNTPLKRLFVFSYFLVICTACRRLIANYFRTRLKGHSFQKKWIKSKLLFSVAASTLVFATFQGQLLPHCQEVIIQLSATETNTGEIWLSEVVADGHEIPISQIYVVENSGWVYSEEYDDYVFYPSEDKEENHFTIKFVAEDISLRFAGNTWSGNVCVTDSLGGYSEYDLYTEDPETERIVHNISSYRNISMAAYIIYGLGAVMILSYSFSVVYNLLAIAYGTESNTYAAISTLILRLKNKLLKVKKSLIPTLWSTQSQKQQIYICAIIFLLTIAFQTIILPNTQRMQIRLQGSCGEVWLTDIIINQKKTDLSKAKVLENEGWIYNEVYDDYVYLPIDGKQENCLLLEIVASEAEVCFASNSWSGEVEVTDSLGGNSHYLLRFSGDFIKTVCHNLYAPPIPVSKRIIYGIGCLVIFFFLVNTIFCYLKKIKNDRLRYHEGRETVAIANPKKDKQCFDKNFRNEIYRYLPVHSVLVLLIYHVMFLTRFSPDGYGIALNFGNDSGNGFLSLGRISSYLVTQFLQIIRFNSMEHQSITAIFFCLIIAWSVTLISTIILQQLPNDNMLLQYIVHGSVLLSFVNVFYVELFYFSDGMILWACGLLFCISALYVFWKSDGWRGIASTILLLYISFGFYQAYLGFFIIFGSIFITLQYLTINDKEMKASLKKWISLLFCGGMASAFILLSMKVMVSIGISNQTERSPTLSWQTIIQNIKKIYFEQYRILVNGMSYIQWGIGITLAIIGIALIIALIRYNVSAKKCIVIWMLFAVDYIIIFAPHVIAQAVWLQPRTLCSYFSLFTFGFILITVVNYMYSNKIPIWIPIWLLIFILINISKIQTIGVEQYVSNTQDRIEAREIVEYIEKYEAESHISVEIIRIHYDAHVTWGYEGIHYAFEDVNRRIEHVAWALGECLQYYTGRQFHVETTSDEKHIELFQERNWQQLLPEEQFVFENEVLYIAAY